MARKNIDTFWDRKTRNDINDNFIELYEGYESSESALDYINSDSLIKPGTISPSQTTFVKLVGKNLFDGKYSYNYILYSNPSDGKSDIGYVDHSNSNPRVTAIIPLEKDVTYTITKYSGGNRFRVALTNKLPDVFNNAIPSIEYHGEGNETGRASWTFKNDKGALYALVLVSVGTGEKPNVQAEIGSNSTDYEPPKYELSANIDIDSLTIPDNSVTYKKTDFITAGKNLFDGDFSYEFSIYSQTETVGHVTPDGSRVSAVIKLEEDTTYTVTKYDGGNRFRVATLNELPTRGGSGVTAVYYHGEGDETGKTSHTFTNENAKYLVVFVGLNANVMPEVQIEEGSEETEYEEFKYKFNKPIDIGTISRTGYNLNDYVSFSKTDVKVFEDGQDVQSDDIIAEYDKLLDDYPDYITKEVLGDGPEGTKLYGYTFKPDIYDIRSAEMEIELPRIVVSSGTHGNEKGTVFGTWNFFNLLCRNWKQEGVLEYLRFNVEFFVIPIVNPTGFDASTRANINDVDLNRDFPRGIDDNDDYSDRELETQILINIMKSEKDNIDFWIDYHTKNWGDFYFYITGRNKLVNNVGSENMATVGRKFSARYDYLPSDENYKYGYSLLGAQNTVTDCNNATGIPGMTLEIVSKLVQEPDGDRYNALAQSLAVEQLANLIRLYLSKIEIRNTMEYFQ